MAKKGFKHLYFGKAGHLFVMSELLLRNWNVAMPEVDIGDDVFVVRDIEPNKENVFLKVQVKSAKIRNVGKNKVALINTSFPQLLSKTGTLIYFFVFRDVDQWKLIIIERDKLLEIHKKNNVGGKYSLNRKKLMLNFYFTKNTITCDDFRFTKYKDDWSEFKRRKIKRTVLK